MKLFNEKQFDKGWFIGNFCPSIINTDKFEISIKRYKKGDYETSHYHKIATEFTAIIQGSVLMNNINYQTGDIIMIEPNESTDFLVLEQTTTVVVKIPSVKDDKYQS